MFSDNETREEVLSEDESTNTEEIKDSPSVVLADADNGVEKQEESAQTADSAIIGNEIHNIDNTDTDSALDTVDNDEGTADIGQTDGNSWSSGAADSVTDDAAPIEDTTDAKVTADSVEQVSDSGKDSEPAQADSDEDSDTEDSEAEDKDSEAAPELTLEDLDEYREAAKIEEPEQLVDIQEFLEMKRKSDEAKKEKESGKKKKKKKKEDIFVNRYKAKTINAAVAAADPVIYFYNAALDKGGKIVFFNVYQVLQDRFMGKLIPQQYTAVAEGSAKIEELNIANIIEQVKICNEYPQYGFVVSVSTRFFTRPNILEKLCKELKADNKNLILAFDCVSLQNIGTAAKTGLSILRVRGAKILLDNTEAVSMTSLTELEYDYIRIDARYYEKGAERPLVYLELLARFAASQGITTAASFCDEGYLAEYMLSRGITAVQGDALSRPMRTVPNTVKAITLLPSMKE